MSPRGDITVILKRWPADPSAALEKLLPIVYDELHRLAANYIRREYDNHTLQPTALINEAYLRLVKQEVASLEDRSHFFGVAARIMRQILVDAARARHAEKRDQHKRTALDGKVDIGDRSPAMDFLALHEALDKLSSHNSRMAQVLELRYFGGLELMEIAGHLSISLATVKRDLALGQAWLRRALTDS